MNEGTPYLLWTVDEIGRDLARKAKQLRLVRSWKQSTLAERSGVTLASLRRFERTGQVSLANLLRLSLALGRLGDFESILRQPEAASLRELEAAATGPTRKRGRA